MEKKPFAHSYLAEETKESCGQMKMNLSSPSDSSERTLSDSERTITADFGGILYCGSHYQEVDSTMEFSLGKQETSPNRCAKTHTDSFGEIPNNGHGDESEVDSASMFIPGKQDLSADCEEIDLRVEAQAKVVPQEKEKVIPKSLKENPANNLSGRKGLKRAQEDNSWGKNQVSNCIAFSGHLVVFDERCIIACIYLSRKNGMSSLGCDLSQMH